MEQYYQETIYDDRFPPLPPVSITKGFSYTLEIDPLFLSFQSTGPMDIEVRQGRAYIDTSGIVKNDLVSIPEINGIWTVTGLSGTVMSGEFKLDLYNVSLPYALDTSNYPNEIGIDSVVAHFQQQQFIRGEVDGSPFGIGLAIRIANTGEITVHPNAVPIPSSAWLFGSAVLGLTARKRLLH